MSAVVLAGGQSRRMGRDKAWAQVRGAPFLTRTVEVVRSAGMAEVFVSGRAGSDYSRLSCPVLHDSPEHKGFGPLAGIEQGLQAATGDRVLVVAVDLVELTSVFLWKLAAAAAQPGFGVVPLAGGRLEPLLAIYPRRALPLLREILRSANRAARDFALACADRGWVRLLEVAASDQRAFVNCNTPEELNAVETCYAGTAAASGLIIQS